MIDTITSRKTGPARRIPPTLELLERISAGEKIAAIAAAAGVSRTAIYVGLKRDGYSVSVLRRLAKKPGPCGMPAYAFYPRAGISTTPSWKDIDARLEVEIGKVRELAEMGACAWAIAREPSPAHWSSDPSPRSSPSLRAVQPSLGAAPHDTLGPACVAMRGPVFGSGNSSRYRPRRDTNMTISKKAIYGALDDNIIRRLDKLRSGNTVFPTVTIKSADVGTKFADPRWRDLVDYCDRHGMTRKVNDDGSVTVSCGFRGEQLDFGM